ncbi:hypothetical protein [Kutzneria albida]|uniref:Putative secreted protein n=1 Tax=Kutzneria albida DSM 43870 TaxID=1449976 RepID=W5W9F1_9PSEU|nr:hypothetical protein [Kutzneria albida]AHH94824.1 putative secreted protein [Kutzneria albida DSM 43870]
MSRLLALVALLMLALAPQAAAHDTGHTPADRVGDLRSEMIPSQLPPGVEVRVLENGQALWLRNPTRIDLVVLDTDGAQRYQVGPDGVAVNSALPPEETPAGDISEDHSRQAADPAATAPQWQRQSTEPVVQWHNHFAHWGDAQLPAAAVSDPDHEHLIRAWQVGLEYDGRHYEIRGELRWIPGPSPVAWVFIALALAIGTWLLAFARRERLLVLPTAVLVVSSAWHGAAMLAGRNAEDGRTVLTHDYLPAIAAGLLGVVAVVLLATDRRNGRWFAALAAIGSGAVALLRDSAVWWSSTSVVALPIDLDRVLVSVTAGVSIGLVAALLTTPAPQSTRSEPSSIS